MIGRCQRNSASHWVVLPGLIKTKKNHERSTNLWEAQRLINDTEVVLQNQSDQADFSRAKLEKIPKTSKGIARNQEDPGKEQQQEEEGEEEGGGESDQGGGQHRVLED